MEANVWYVKAAEAGDERANIRLATIRAAASGATPQGDTTSGISSKIKKTQTAPEKAGQNDKECTIM